MVILQVRLFLTVAVSRVSSKVHPPQAQDHRNHRRDQISSNPDVDQHQYLAVRRHRLPFPSQKCQLF